MNSVNDRVSNVETGLAKEVSQVKAKAEQQDQRLHSLEQNLGNISASMVTKSDLSVTLKEALQQQVQDLRGLLAKRSPDVTPTSDASKVARHS